MEVQKYCVYNQTRESFLSLGVTVADPATAQVRELIDKVGAKPDSGLWMVPYRGNLPARGHSPVDLLYLDGEYRVIQEVESFLPSALEPLKDSAASALVLPAHTIYSSQTQPGDQMVICIAEEMERRLERLSVPLNPHAQTVVSSKEKHVGNGASVAAASLTYADNKEMSHSIDNSDQSELKTGRRGSLLGWIQSWLSSSSDRRRAPRQPLPGVVAYYWTGSTPRAYQIAVRESGVALPHIARAHVFGRRAAIGSCIVETQAGCGVVHMVRVLAILHHLNAYRAGGATAGVPRNMRDQ